MRCPYCNHAAELVGGLEVYPHRPELAEKKFWLCRPCDAYVGCHASGSGRGDGSTPLGRLANAELRRAKMSAHTAFDPLWKTGKMERREAYTWLAERLGIPVERAHIGEFDVAQCMKVVQAVKELHTPVSCPNCPDQGWYPVADVETGDPVQEQCEFCHTVPNSVYYTTVLHPSGHDRARQ